MPSKEETIRDRLYNFYSKNHHFGKKFTVTHFLNEGVPRKTIYDICKRYDNGISSDRQAGSGRKPEIFKKRKIDELISAFDNKGGISTRKAAQKFKCSQSMIRHVLKKSSVQYRKRKVIPKRTELQMNLAKTKCGRLYLKFSKRQFILDDESYFTLNHSRISGNSGYYSSDVSATPSPVKFVTKQKFEAKVLVWIAIGPKGLSRPLIRKSGFSINAQTYLDECIRKRLIPYIHSNYAEGSYVFWPDQATAHYAKTVLEHLNTENIEFVQKTDNPANVPEVRCIEDFWAYLKQLVYKDGWGAKNIDQLINRIRYCLKKIDHSVVQKLAASTLKRIDSVRRFGVIEK